MNSSAHPILRIPFLGESLSSDYQEMRATLLKSGVPLKIDKINWQEYPFQPEVKVICGYSYTQILLLFEVENDFFRATAKVDQDSVWEDSCVEFFVTSQNVEEFSGQLLEKIVYRNFEFNCQGVCFSASGTKSDRTLLEADEMASILRFPVIQSQNQPEEGDRFNWELIVAIPLDLLGLKRGDCFFANFYKCGDLTREVHFLSWNPIAAESPDFHLPGFFGKVQLAL